MRWLRALAGVALAAVLLGAGAAWLLLQGSRLPREGEVVVAGLEAPVRVTFDARARPFVRAETLGDALFVEGFLHARERLFQMELVRRAGRGALAEALGPGLLETDRALWRGGVPQLARRLLEGAGPETLARVDRYVAGVNAGIATLRVLPPELLLARIEAPRWEPLDVFAAGAMTAWQSANNAENELLRFALAQVVSPEELAAFLPDESEIPDFPYVVGAEKALATLRAADARDARRQPLLAGLSLGSNGWAVAPARSASGAALFAFDSHDALSMPNLLYEVHLFFDAGRAIRGFSLPGLPGVVNGWNHRLAWGFTNIGDSQDLFLETRHPEDPLRFQGPDGWYEAREEEIRIPVAGRDEPERLRIVYTRHGPLVEDDPPLALAWSGHRVGSRGLDALFELNLAESFREASDALDRLPAPSANASYADRDGRIAVRTLGSLPLRGRGEGLLPLPGHERGVAWRGMVPARSLPREVDPARGFAAAANARVQPAGRTPLVSADNAPGYRMARIRAVLASRARHTEADMRALQSDWHNGQAGRLLPALLAALPEAPLREPAEAARRVLAAWGAAPENRPELPGPLVFERFYAALAERVFAERLGEALYARLLRRSYVLNHALDGLILDPAADSPWWRGDRRALVRDAFTAATDALARDFGPEPAAWRWDAVHRVTLRHELARAVPLLSHWLDRGPLPWGGGNATVGRARHRYDRPHEVTGAATVRVVIEMSEPMRAWAVMPGGQSGHPGDPHYDDQLEAWLRGDHDLLASRPEEVVGTTLSLTPPRP